MKWADLSPYVLPHVFGCPDLTMEQHVRLAAADFFRRTLAWRETLEAVASDGTEAVELEPPNQAQIIKIKSVSVAGREFPLVETTHGMELSRASAGREFVFTQDGRTVRVFPPQAAGTLVVAEAALVPSLASTSLPDALGYLHMQDIANGAIASLKRLHGVPFADLKGSVAAQELFERRISAVAAKHSRGLMAAKLRSRPTFL